MHLILDFNPLWQYLLDIWRSSLFLVERLEGFLHIWGGKETGIHCTQAQENQTLRDSTGCRVSKHLLMKKKYWREKIEFIVTAVLSLLLFNNFITISLSMIKNIWLLFRKTSSNLHFARWENTSTRNNFSCFRDRPAKLRGPVDGYWHGRTSAINRQWLLRLAFVDRFEWHTGR